MSNKHKSVPRSFARSAFTEEVLQRFVYDQLTFGKTKDIRALLPSFLRRLEAYDITVVLRERGGKEHRPDLFGRSPGQVFQLEQLLLDL